MVLLFKYVTLLLITCGALIGIGYFLSWANKGGIQTKTVWDYIAMVFAISLVFLGSWLQQR